MSWLFLPVVSIVAIAITWMWAVVAGHPNRNRKAVAVAFLLLLGWLTVDGATVFWPKADTMLKKGEAVEVAATGTNADLLVSSDLPDSAIASEKYEIDVVVDNVPVGLVAGTLEEHFESAKAGRRGTIRRLVKHTEKRHPLPDAVADKAFKLKIRGIEGAAARPLHLQVLRAQAPIWIPFAACIALVVVGLVFDRLERTRAKQTNLFGIMAAFILLLRTGVTPHAPPQTIFGAALVAVLLGPAGVWVLRDVVETGMHKKTEVTEKSEGEESKE